MTDDVPKQFIISSNAGPSLWEIVRSAIADVIRPHLKEDNNVEAMTLAYHIERVFEEKFDVSLLDAVKAKQGAETPPVANNASAVLMELYRAIKHRLGPRMAGYTMWTQPGQGAVEPFPHSVEFTVDGDTTYTITVTKKPKERINFENLVGVDHD